MSKKPRAETELETVKKLRVIVEVNPWRAKEGTKASGALWRDVLETLKDNGVMMNYGVAKRPAHALHELVGRSVKVFRTRYPDFPLNPVDEALMAEKDKLVYQIIQYKEEAPHHNVSLPEFSNLPESVVKDRTQSGQKRSHKAFLEPDVEKSNAVGLPARMPSPALFTLADAEFSSSATESRSETASPSRKLQKRLGATDLNEDFQERLTSTDRYDDLPKVDRTNGPDLLSILSRILAAMQETNEIERLRLEEKKQAREASRKLQQEEAAKDRAFQLEIAKLDQETDLQKFKLMLEYSKK